MENVHTRKNKQPAPSSRVASLLVNRFFEFSYFDRIGSNCAKISWVASQFQFIIQVDLTREPIGNDGTHAICNPRKKNIIEHFFLSVPRASPCLAWKLIKCFLLFGLSFPVNCHKRFTQHWPDDGKMENLVDSKWGT